MTTKNLVLQLIETFWYSLKERFTVQISLPQLSNYQKKKKKKKR
jgi:hypothetical protein